MLWGCASAARRMSLYDSRVNFHLSREPLHTALWRPSTATKDEPPQLEWQGSKAPGWTNTAPVLASMAPGCISPAPVWASTAPGRTFMPRGEPLQYRESVPCYGGELPRLQRLASMALGWTFTALQWASASPGWAPQLQAPELRG